MHVKSNHTFDINCHCDSIIDFLANSYFIVQIYHEKSFKMKYSMSLYLNFLFEYSYKCLKACYEIACIRRYVICSGRFFEKSCQIATAQSQITSYSIALNYLPNNGVMHHIWLERWNYLRKLFLIWSQSSKIPNQITFLHLFNQK